MTTVRYEITSWLIPCNIQFEDYTQTEREVFFVAARFGSRCFVHFKPFYSEDDTSSLLERVRAAAPSADHILASEHWGPHPYCDGTLEQRLAVEADVEEQERFAYNNGLPCDTDKARQTAAEEIVG